MAPKTDVKSKKNQKRKLEASDDDRPRKSRKTSFSDSDNEDVNQKKNRQRKYKPVEEETIIEDLAVKPKKNRKIEDEISLNVEKPKKNLNKESRTSVDDSEDEPSRAAVKLKKNHSKKSEASKEDISSNDKKSKKNGHKKSDQSGEKVNHKKSEFSEDEDASDESTEQKKKSKRKSGTTKNGASVKEDVSEKLKKSQKYHGKKSEPLQAADSEDADSSGSSDNAERNKNRGRTSGTSKISTAQKEGASEETTETKKNRKKKSEPLQDDDESSGNSDGGERYKNRGRTSGTSKISATQKEGASEESTETKKNRKRKSEPLQDDDSKDEDKASENSDDAELYKNHKKKSGTSNDAALQGKDASGNSNDDKRNENRKRKSHPVENVDTGTSNDVINKSLENKKSKGRLPKESESLEDFASETSDTNESSGNGKSPTNAKAKNGDHTKPAVQRKSPNKTCAILFIDFIKDLKLYGTDRLKKYKGKPDIAKIADGIPELQQYRELYTKPSFNTDFNALYTVSARRKHITVDLVVGATERFLNDGSSVESFDNFPKSPSTPINAYIASHHDGHSTLRDYTKLRHKFSSGDVDTKPYFDKYAEECQTYMEELKQYMKEYSDYLLDSHKAHINSIISKTFKTVNAKDFGTIKKKPNNGKEKKTAFDWFKDAFPELCAKYDDDETRDQKLRKKFEKLSEAERNVYENIAAKNS